MYPTFHFIVHLIKLFDFDWTQSSTINFHLLLINPKLARSLKVLFIKLNAI